MTIRLIFTFLFQWIVTGITQTLAWIIPDRPRGLRLKIKREQYLAADALRKHKILIGKRKTDKESSCSEDESGQVNHRHKSQDKYKTSHV